MQHDNTKTKSAVKFALPVKIGNVQVGVVIEDLEEMLKELKMF